MANLQFDTQSRQDYDPSLYKTDHIATPMTRWDQLDVSTYHKVGYLALDGALSPEQVEDARAGLMDLIHGKNPDYDQIQFEQIGADEVVTLTPEQREMHVRKLFNFCKFDERLDAIMRDPTLINFVTKLLGDREPVCFQEMALLKPPHGREKPWHQDNAYFDLDINEPVVGVWIALDDATVENGCMHVIPGSHHNGAHVHFKRRDWQICDTDILGQKITAVPLMAGGLMFFNGLMYHGTPFNPTNLRRRALQLHYCPKDAKWTNEEARLALFGSEGKDVTC